MCFYQNLNFNWPKTLFACGREAKTQRKKSIHIHLDWGLVPVLVIAGKEVGGRVTRNAEPTAENLAPEETRGQHTSAVSPESANDTSSDVGTSEGMYSGVTLALWRPQSFQLSLMCFFFVLFCFDFKLQKWTQQNQQRIQQPLQVRTFFPFLPLRVFGGRGRLVKHLVQPDVLVPGLWLYSWLVEPLSLAAR